MNYKIQKNPNGVITVEGEQDARDYVKTINIPTITVSDTNLSPNEKFVIGIINSFQANRREFFASNRFIANSIGIKPTSVQNILTSLEKKGYLVRTFYDQDKKMRKGISLSPTYVNNIYNVSLENDRVSFNNDRVSFNNDRGVSLNNDHTKQDNTKQIYKKEKQYFGLSKKEIKEKFLLVFNKVTERKMRTLDSKAERQLFALLDQGIHIKEIGFATVAAASNDFLRGANEGNVDYLTPEYITRPAMFNKWIAIYEEEQDKKTRKENIIF